MRKTFVVLLLAAVVSLAATGCGGGSPSAPSAAEELTIASVTPNTGLATSGTGIVIRGTGFQAGMNVTLGDIALTYSFINSTQISAGVPPRPPGPADLVIKRTFGPQATLPNAFTWLSPVDRIAISGNLALTAAGQTSQLTVTATLEDGSTQNVTNSCTWFVTLSSVATVAPGGLLTAVGPGGTSIAAQYPATNAGPATRLATATVTVTQPGTFVASGRTREGGLGDVSGVLVTNPASGRSTMSAGVYTIGGLTDDRLTLTRDGYEPVEIRATPNGFDDVPMQRILRVTAGGTAVTGRLAPNDTSYDVGGGARCDPCKLVRISGSGAVNVRLTWTAPSRVLSMWINGVRVSANPGSQELVTPVNAAGEVIIYIGSTDALGFSEHIPFSITGS